MENFDTLRHIGDILYEAEAHETFLDFLEEQIFLIDEEGVRLDESLRRRVSSTGQIRRILRRDIRRRRATQTTGRSRTELRRAARKAARTRRRNPSVVRKANRKRRRAMRRRKQMGFRKGS